jgi:hypothetical protein
MMLGYLRATLLISGIGMVLAGMAILTHDLTLEIRYRSAFATTVGPIPAIPKRRWRTAVAFAMLGWAPLMIAIGLAAFVVE